MKDSVSNSEIIKSITVTAQEDHEEPNITSQGVLAISGEADTKINPLNATIIFEAKDATLSSTALDNLEVSINGHRTSPTVSIQNNLISLSSFLKEGLNSIEISTLDSNELLITGKAEIWAGNNSLTVNPIGSQGTVLAPPFVITSFLAKNTLVKSALSGTTISNLPPEKVLVLLEDANGNLGTAVSNASKTNSMVDVVMYPKTQSDTPQNNDFQEGLSGWNIINGTGSIASHFENGQVFNENKDLTVAGENQIRISRIIDNSLNFRTASLRFLIQTGLEKNDFALVFRGLDSQTNKVIFLSVEKNLPNTWLEYSFSNSIQGEPVEVVLINFPKTSLSSSNYNVPVNSILDIAGSVLLPKALAIDGNPSFVVVDNAKSSNVCVNNPRLIDLVPTKANAEAISPSIKNESWYVLNQLSIGAIPTSYNEGANQIAARLSLCDNTSVTDWQLEAVVPGKSIILGTKNSVTPPISLPSYDVEFTLSNPALIEIKNALGENPNEIELHLFAFDDSTHITKTNVFHRKVQLLVRDNINSIYRYNAERDNIQGGDDWMRPKTLNLIKAMVERYKNLPQLDRFTFNDISNMNGSYFPGHWNHNLGLSIDANLRGYNLPNNAANVPVENIESLKKLFDFFKIYHEDLGKIIFTHTRPIKELVGSTAWLKKHTEIVESEDDPTYFFENETTFNRLRYQCIENRLMRRLVESEPYHGNHYHFEIEEVNAPIRVKQPGTIKVKMSQEKKGVLKFEPEIFTWASDVRHEVFYEKELSDGTFEFVPLQAGVNPLGSEVYGKVKLKFLKIDKSSGDYACSNKFENALPEFASNEDVEYVTVNLVPEGVCKGEFLKPVRGTFGDNGTSNEVGWVSPDAILDKGNIGANSYLCKGSSLKDYSELYGGPDGLLEVTNSQISKGTVVYGNVRIDNSNIDHADILGPASNGPWTPETKYSSIQYADITDVLNEPTGIGYVGPNQIYGMVNMLGSASARVYVDRASLPITAPDSPPGIQGTQILSAAQVINILGGAKISNSFISGRYDSSLEGKELSISGNSEINSSSLVGHLSVSGNSKITSSGLYASDSTAGGPTDPPTPPILGINFINTLSRSLASVTEEKAMEIYDVVVTSSSIGVKGKISGPDTHILNSFIYGNALIGKESTVKDSDVSEIQIERAKIISCLETRNLTISNSLVENSQVQYSSIVDSKIINSSTVLSSTIGTNSEISSSEVNLSKIESSKVLNASRIYESTQILNSTINNLECGENFVV